MHEPTSCNNWQRRSIIIIIIHIYIPRVVIDCMQHAPQIPVLDSHGDSHGRSLDLRNHNEWEDGNCTIFLAAIHFVQSKLLRINAISIWPLYMRSNLRSTRIEFENYIKIPVLEPADVDCGGSRHANFPCMGCRNSNRHACMHARHSYRGRFSDLG